MSSTTDRLCALSARTLLSMLMVLCLPGGLHAGEQEMTLRINDTMADAGGLAAIVLRTYAPRGISQGQICFRGSTAARADGETPTGPFAALEQVVVFSETGDAEVVETFDGGTQTTLIEFESLSATINWADGPLAVLYFRVDELVTPGQEFVLELDLADTFAFDADGQPITLVPRAGELGIRGPGDPYGLSAEGDAVGPGEVAMLGVETSELFAVGDGQVAVRYDPAFTVGVPTVSMDLRHGNASFDVDDSQPGRVVVSFVSPDGSLNEVPGEFVSIQVQVSPDAVIGTQSTVTLDPLLTFLNDPQGAPIPLALTGDLLEVVTGGLIFADGFEAGLSRWIVVQ